jgi:flagellar basal body P-ring formation protein FlgA
VKGTLAALWEASRENIGPISRAKPGQFEPTRRRALPTVVAVDKSFVAALLLVLAAPLGVRADVLDEPLTRQVQALALAAQALQAAPGLSVELRIGRLDPRLKLAPCAAVQPYLPTGTRLWGAARIGLRCADPGVRWNVFLPITVDVFGPGWVATGPLAVGAVLRAGDLKPATVNLSAEASPALASSELALGRTLARPLAAGEPLRAADLRARQWFAAGDTVRITAVGAGWRIHGEGQALNPGLEGQMVRVRTESGRVVSGMAVAQRQIEVAL